MFQIYAMSCRYYEAKITISLAYALHFQPNSLHYLCHSAFFLTLLKIYNFLLAFSLRTTFLLLLLLCMNVFVASNACLSHIEAPTRADGKGSSDVYIFQSIVCPSYFYRLCQLKRLLERRKQFFTLAALFALLFIYMHIRYLGNWRTYTTKCWWCERKSAKSE